MKKNHPHAARAAATVIAHPNIALVKYWGKRDEQLNLPATGSLSITLDELQTRTRISLCPELEAHDIAFDGVSDSAGAARAAAHLDVIAELAGSTTKARVTTNNNFPTSAGLASSASGFAALTLAAVSSYGLSLSPAALSALARRGSGSAARSLFGGFALMHKGARGDGSDSFAECLQGPDYWPLNVVVAVVNEGPKPVASTGGMMSSARTSAFYPQWVSGHDSDLQLGTAAVAARDFEKLAHVSEASCLKMHAVMMAGDPALLYWQSGTITCIEAIRQLQREGVGVFFTIDAGPQVKAVCLPEFRDRVATTLGELACVTRTMVTGLGPGAYLVDPADGS